MANNYIIIHHSAPHNSEHVYYKNGKKYTYEEYSKIIYKKQRIKEIIFITAYSIFVLLRAYVFLKYDI